MTKEDRIDALRLEFKKAIRKLEKETLKISVPDQEDPDWIFMGIETEDVQTIIRSHTWYMEQMSKAYSENVTTPGMYGVCLSIRKLHEYDRSDEKHKRLAESDKKAKEIVAKFKEDEKLIMDEVCEF